MQNHFRTLPREREKEREREIESTMNVHESREKHSRRIEGILKILKVNALQGSCFHLAEFSSAIIHIVEYATRFHDGPPGPWWPVINNRLNLFLFAVACYLWTCFSYVCILYTYIRTLGHTDTHTHIYTYMYIHAHTHIYIYTQLYTYIL